MLLDPDANLVELPAGTISEQTKKLESTNLVKK